MNVEAVDRAALNDSGLGCCATCKTICQLDAMVSEPSRKHRRRCKACHAQRMSRRNREKALQYATEAQKRGGAPILSAPRLPQKGLPINPKLDQIIAV
jgi:MinD superfamily P-loop ATPase